MSESNPGAKMDLSADLDDYCHEIANRFKRFPEALSVAYEACVEHNGNKEKIFFAVLDAYRCDSLISHTTDARHKKILRNHNLQEKSFTENNSLGLLEFKQHLTEFECKVCDLLVEGYSALEIITILNSNSRAVYSAINVLRFRLEKNLC